MERKFLAGALALVSFNFLFLSNSSNHVKIGLIWLAVDIVLWLPQIKRLLAAK